MAYTLVEREIRLREEIIAAVKWCAARGIEGWPGDRLPELLSCPALSWINSNGRGFREQIRAERVRRPNDQAKEGA